MLDVDVTQTCTLEEYLSRQDMTITRAKEGLGKLRENILELVSDMCFVSCNCLYCGGLPSLTVRVVRETVSISQLQL